MIEQVSYSTTQSTGNIRPITGTQIKPVPPTGTIVNVNVLDKVGAEYKILVDGSLFRSKLPFAANGGDDFLAKIIKADPFTLSVDNFTSAVNLKDSNLGAILSLLNLEDTAKVRLLLKKVISEGKPLLKSKVKTLVDFYQNFGLEADDYQVAVVINLIWMNELDNRQRQFKEIQNIFSLSFEELCFAIYESIVKLNTMNLHEGFYTWINKLMCTDLSSAETGSHLLPLKDKSHAILSFLTYLNVMLDDSPLSANHKKELKKLKELLVQYILQKGLFTLSNLYPEFTIIKTDKKLELCLFGYQRINSGSTCSNFKLTAEVVNDNKKSALNVIYANEQIFGELAYSNSNVEDYANNLTMFTNNVQRGLELKLNINVSTTVDSNKKQLKKINNRI
ncbi:MAG: hypothetical protein V1720_01260 [bacterium]